MFKAASNETLYFDLNSFTVATPNISLLFETKISVSNGTSDGAAVGKEDGELEGIPVGEREPTPATPTNKPITTANDVHQDPAILYTRGRPRRELED